jgi:hypothetical protein
MALCEYKPDGVKRLKQNRYHQALLRNTYAGSDPARVLQFLMLIFKSAT